VIRRQLIFCETFVSLHCCSHYINTCNGPWSNAYQSQSKQSVERVSFRSGAGRIVSQHPLVMQNYSYSSYHSFYFFVRERALGAGYPYSPTQWSTVFLYWFCWVFAHTITNQGPIYPCSERCFFLPTMQLSQSSQFSLESDV